MPVSRTAISLAITSIRPQVSASGSNRRLTAAVNRPPMASVSPWYPNLNMKFMPDYEHVVVDNPQVFGGPNYRGATIDWIAGRTQLIF
jgi:hypothetical protein